MSRTKTKYQILAFNSVIIWSLITSLFTWLPLLRIIGRPEEYYWGVFGFSGEGTQGPYWIFIAGCSFVLGMFYSVFRVENRIYSYILLPTWNFFLLFLVIYGWWISTDSTLQGQGLHWEFPLFLLLIPTAIFAFLACLWVRMELKNGLHFKISTWQKRNTVLLLTALILMLIAILLFHLGDNYNWITSTAIIVTIFQWIVLIESLKPVVSSGDKGE